MRRATTTSLQQIHLAADNLAHCITTEYECTFHIKHFCACCALRPFTRLRKGSETPEYQNIFLELENLLEVLEDEMQVI